jgi:hypothetical protein
VKHLAFMSAAGANPTAAATGSGAAGMARYARVKGEAEEGEREWSGCREHLPPGDDHRIATVAARESASCVLVRHAREYTSITVEKIAKAMIATSLNTPATSDVYHYPEMIALIGDCKHASTRGHRLRRHPLRWLCDRLPRARGHVLAR